MAAERFSSKRYGVRYGRKLREKVGKIEQEKRSDNVCPYCRYKKVKRVASGIWFCSKCSSRFTGRAYRIGKKVDEAAAEAPAAAAAAAVPGGLNG